MLANRTTSNDDDSDFDDDANAATNAVVDEFRDGCDDRKCIDVDKDDDDGDDDDDDDDDGDDDDNDSGDDADSDDADDDSNDLRVAMSQRRATAGRATLSLSVQSTVVRRTVSAACVA